MIRRISFFYNLGVTDSLSIFDKRRIRLINAFALISIVLILIFSTTNFLFGSKFQGALLISGLVYVSIPPLYFNYKTKYFFSRHYFTIVSLAFTTYVSYNAILTGHARYNEIFMVGYAAFIIIIFEKRQKVLYFLLSALITLSMVATRKLYFDLPFEADTFLSFVNVISSFLCVYFFTSVYKNDLINSNNKLIQTTGELEMHKKELMLQRDKINENKKLLRSAIDSLPVFIALLDVHGKYLIANAKYEETFDLPIADIEGKHYQEVLPKNIVNTHKKYIDKGLSGKEVDFEETTHFPNGSTLEVFGRYIPVYNDSEKQIGLAVYVVDISKLKATEEQLITLNESKNRLLSLISHDIRSPLHSLNGLISLADNVKEDELKPLLKKVSDKLALVNFNLDNLLNWAKAQMDGFSLKPDAIQIEQLIKETINLYEEKFKEKNILVSIKSLSDTKPVWIDHESIKLVLRNIIRNAIKFSHDKSTIFINSYESNGAIRVEIQNQGECMPHEKIKALNKGALTLDSTVGTLGEQGTGLGLSLSLEIMKQNKGKLSINVDEKERFTRIILDFPIAHLQKKMVDQD